MDATVGIEAGSGGSQEVGATYWRYQDLTVAYSPELDGGGMALAESFVGFVERYSGGRVFSAALEWCAGPGFLGFALLARGLGPRLCLADINPAGVRCVNETIRANGLEDRVTAVVGDNLAELPGGDSFDLVVGNPPNFFRLNPRHPRYEELKDDLRPTDRGWRLHQDFYRDVGGLLAVGALLFISEVECFEATVYDPRSEPEPYDLRERPAVDDLLPMIADGGLRCRDIVPYYTAATGSVLYMMVSEMSPDAEATAASGTCGR